MKLIIDIPEEALKEMNTKEFISIESIDTAIECIKNGILLDSNSERAEVQAYFDGEAYGWEQGRKALIDDVKTEIEKEENIWYHDCEPENDWKKFDVIRVDTVFEILDHIGKEGEE
jgi:hypothetical protein